MRFFAVNLTGTAVHVRLDRDAAESLVLTLSKRKIVSRKRPLTEFVMVTKTPVRISHLDGDVKVEIVNPDRLIFTVAIDHDKDRMLTIRGFVQ